MPRTSPRGTNRFGRLGRLERPFTPMRLKKWVAAASMRAGFSGAKHYWSCSPARASPICPLVVDTRYSGVSPVVMA
jgi:hypothetical protein